MLFTDVDSTQHTEHTYMVIMCCRKFKFVINYGTPSNKLSFFYVTVTVCEGVCVYVCVLSDKLLYAVKQLTVMLYFSVTRYK